MVRGLDRQRFFRNDRDRRVCREVRYGDRYDSLQGVVPGSEGGSTAEKSWEK
jgi:hypothetical protein